MSRPGSRNRSTWRRCSRHSRDYLTKLREEAYIDIKPGYLDTGASPNETQPIYTTASNENSNSGKEKKKKKLGLF